VTSAKAADQNLQVDDRGTVDVSSLRGKAWLRFGAERVSSL
jgi:hypothetical protein